MTSLSLDCQMQIEGEDPRSSQNQPGGISLLSPHLPLLHLTDQSRD
jgi:hypothetical protein